MLTDAILGIVGKVLDRVIPDPVAKQEANLKLLELAQQGELAQLAADTDLAKGQLDINKVEAANENIFVSGWRPGVGWVCVAALANNMIIRPYASIVFKVEIPSLDMGDLMALMAGLLGLGSLRSYDKRQTLKYGQ